MIIRPFICDLPHVIFIAAKHKYIIYTSYPDRYDMEHVTVFYHVTSRGESRIKDPFYSFYSIL